MTVRARPIIPPATNSGLNNLVLASSFTGSDPSQKINNALLALPGTGGCVVADESGGISATITPSAPNTSIYIPPWITLTKTANGSMFLFSQANCGITGAGTINANKGTYTGHAVNFQAGGDYGFVRSTNGTLTIKDAEIDGVEHIGVTGLRVEAVNFSGCGMSAISGQEDADHTLIRDNTITHGGTQSAIQMHSHSGGKSVDHCRILDNYIDISSVIFGIDVDGNSGDSPIGLVVRGNTVNAIGPSNPFGGISFPECTNPIIEENRYFCNAYGTAGYGIELTRGIGGIVRNNVIHGGTTLLWGIIVNNQLGSILSGNQIYGFKSSATSGGIQIFAGDDAIQPGLSEHCSDDTQISDNQIIFLDSAANGKGIDLFTNAADATINRCLVHGNKIIGLSGTTTKGIKLSQNTTGTIDSTFIDGNVSTSVTTKISQSGDTNTTIGTNT